MFFQSAGFAKKGAIVFCSPPYPAPPPFLFTKDTRYPYIHWVFHILRGITMRFIRPWSYMKIYVYRSYSFNFGKSYLCSFNSSPPYKTLKNAKCSTPKCKCGTTFFLANMKVCQLLIFGARQACVPPLSVPPLLFSSSTSRWANLRCAICFFFVAPSKCATEGGVPADEGNCVSVAFSLKGPFDSLIFF